MSKERHPLEEGYDLIGYEPKFDDDLSVDIPEHADLDTVIEMSLYAYKAQVERINSVPPEFQQSLWDSAQKFMTIVKDSIYKKQYLSLQRQKEQARNKREGVLNEESGDSADTGTPPQTFTREQLLEMNSK